MTSVNPEIPEVEEGEESDDNIIGLKARPESLDSKIWVPNSTLK